ncbi:MAG: type IV pilin protein [Deltaproteobacteria bacterium]
MNKKHAFTLMEMTIAVVILGILMLVAAPRFMDRFERMRGAEARHTLLQAYLGFQRLVSDGAVINNGNCLTWQRMGMSDPNADAEGFFNYTMNNPGNPNWIDATRIGNSTFSFRMFLATGRLQVQPPY